MNARERLAEIETCYGEFGSQSIEVHVAWLIARVKRLTKALEEIIPLENWDNACGDIARKALEGDDDK